MTLKNARTNLGLTKKEVVNILNSNYFIVITEGELTYYESYSENIPVEIASSLSLIYALTIDDIIFVNSSTISYTNDVLTACFDNYLLDTIRGIMYNRTFKCIEIPVFI